jgi:hypothetical protein
MCTSTILSSRMFLKTLLLFKIINGLLLQNLFKNNNLLEKSLVLLLKIVAFIIVVFIDAKLITWRIQMVKLTITSNGMWFF